jgi:hypothetical protein
VEEVLAFKPLAASFTVSTGAGTVVLLGDFNRDRLPPVFSALTSAG